MKTKVSLISLIAAVIVFGVIFAPVEVPYTINSIAKILPAQQMIFLRGADGEVITNVANNISGINHSSRQISFERGESMMLDLDPELSNGQIVKKGDTLGLIYSSNQ